MKIMIKFLLKTSIKIRITEIKIPRIMIKMNIKIPRIINF